MKQGGVAGQRRVWLLTAEMTKMGSFQFYYDIVCPFAYMSSSLVEVLAERCGAKVTWTPVLLGGLYEHTQAAQGKAGSATDVMSPAKWKISGQDLRRQLFRRGVLYREPLSHPQKTVTAMRLLSAITDNSTRAQASHNLFKAYWYLQRDVTDLSVLQDALDPLGLSATELLQLPAASSTLRANTLEASNRGAFGVPSFFVKEKLYFGTDRLFFVERELTSTGNPERLALPPCQGVANLTFFFDYSSPWSFLAMERLKDTVSSVFPVNVKIEWVPILLGALFKEIGTPMIPGAAMNTVKRNYYQKDLLDWCSYAGVEIKWPDTFPLRSVLPLRVTLAASCDPDLIARIYRAAWRENKNIGDPEVLKDILDGWSSTSKHLLEAAGSPEVKQMLFTNTKRAEEEGLCGVPSFQVNGGEVIWGQDKLNIVADMLCGWQPLYISSAKL